MISSHVSQTVASKRACGDGRRTSRSLRTHTTYTEPTMLRISPTPSFTFGSSQSLVSTPPSPILHALPRLPSPDSIPVPPPPTRPCQPWALRPPSSISSTYTLILEPTSMIDVTVPLQVTVSYETDWPLLLLTDRRSVQVAEEGYLCQQNFAACAAIRHLGSAVEALERDIRAALYLRPRSEFALRVPDLNNTPVTPLVVIKSLVTQLLDDSNPTTSTPGGWMSSSMTCQRASILGRGCYRLRVDHDTSDSLQPYKYIARIHIHSPLSRLVNGRTVHFPVVPNIEAIAVVQMVHDLVNTYTTAPTVTGSRMGLAEAGGRGPKIRLFLAGKGGEGGGAGGGEVMYGGGAILPGGLFRREEGRLCVDLEAKWG